MNVRILGVTAVILLGAGAEIASAGPRWCKRYKAEGEVFAEQVKSSFESYKSAKRAELLPEVAGYLTVVECKETNKIDRVLEGGKVEYRKACRDAGTAVADNAPPPATIPASCTSGVAKGRFVFMWDIPWLVYTDKTRKKIVAAYCIPFD